MEKGNRSAQLFFVTMLLMAGINWLNRGDFIISYPLALPFVGALCFYLLVLERRTFVEYLLMGIMGLAHLALSQVLIEIFINNEMHYDLVETPILDLIHLLLYLCYFIFAILSIRKFDKSISKTLALFSCFTLMIPLVFGLDLWLIIPYGFLSLAHLLNRKWKPFDQIFYVLFLAKTLEIGQILFLYVFSQK